MTDDRYDDGLVHNHAWATEPPAPAGRRMIDPGVVAAAFARHAEEDGFDDGLVHDHAWACGERGRLQMAG